MSVAQMLVISAVPVLCFAVGYLCGRSRQTCKDQPSDTRPPLFPRNTETIDHIKAW
jgi:hypothetical protein